MTLDKIGVTVVLLLLFANSTTAEDHIPASFKVDQIEGLHYACDNTTAPQNHFIYCSGRILQAVQAFKLFEDSKTFVDKPMKYSPLEVLQKFEERFPEDENITKEALQEFVDENFEGTCHELADCELEDWNPNPPSFKDIANQDYFKWATGLNDIWKKLCRKMNPEIKNAPERYSLIYVEHPFVVPGGRFREFYYWDSYWTIKGLLVSGMYKTVEHMLMNFASMVEQYGMIPNGGRVYYLTRSQPPLLAGMFLEYYKASGNKKFVEKYLPVLEKEFQFWNSSRRVDVKLKSGETHSVFQYRADSDAPRPESFREDVEIIKQLTSDSKKKTVWKDLASAAESGWDFSSRWFADKLSLATIETTNVVPVDLNAYICWNLKILRQFHDEISGNKEKVDQFGKLLDAHRSALQAVFFVDNENQTGWFDYNLRSEVHNFEFYPSSVTPLFTKVVENLGAEMEEKIYNNMKLKGAFSEDGGVPTSLKKNTNQQWDFPNGWAPLNHMVIQAFVNAESSNVQKAGIELAKKWLHNNFHTFSKANVMWEKYDVTGKEGAGDGGEYEVQAGFGWSNGVALDLITSLGSRIFEGKHRKIAYHPKAEAFVFHSDSSKSTQSVTLNVFLLCLGRLLY